MHAASLPLPLLIGERLGIKQGASTASHIQAVFVLPELESEIAKQRWPSLLHAVCCANVNLSQLGRQEKREWGSPFFGS